MKNESAIQSECVLWLWNNYRRTRGLLYHIPNGGSRTAREGATFKAMGVVAGIPDLCLAIPMNGCPALYIEMKTDIGKLSPAQSDAIGRLTSAGNRVELCRSFEEFKSIVVAYLQGSVYLQVD